MDYGADSVKSYSFKIISSRFILHDFLDYLLTLKYLLHNAILLS